MLLGEVLLCAASFLFLKELVPQHLFTLNTIVLSIVYLLIFSFVFDVFDDLNLKSNSSTAGIGITWTGIIVYSLIAVALVVASYSWEWKLIYAIFAQCAALFVLLIFVFMSRSAVDSVEYALQNVEVRKESLKLVYQQFENLEIEVKLNPDQAIKSQQIERLKRELRFITYSDGETAMNLDQKLVNTLSEMTLMLSHSQFDNNRWLDAVERCEALIKLRKQQI